MVCGCVYVYFIRCGRGAISVRLESSLFAEIGKVNGPNRNWHKETLLTVGAVGMSHDGPAGT